MNLEPNSPKVPSQEPSLSLSAISVSAEELRPTGVAIHPSEAIGLETEDIALAKAATLLIDTPESVVDEGFKAPVEKELRYVQGVVQSRHAFIITNLLQGQSQTLCQPQMVWTLGRNRGAALPLQDRAMSRRHAVILYIQSVGFYLIDLNSMNGSFVNGVRIQQRQLLADGDLIQLGSTNFVFFLSHGVQAIDAIHPEVLARFNTSKPYSGTFIDYSELEEPEILFRTPQT